MMKIEFMNFKLNDREEFETYLNQKAQETMNFIDLMNFLSF